MLNATQMSDIVSDARKALKINDYHSAIYRLTVVMDNLIARVPNPDAPPPAPSDDVYLPGGLPWKDGAPVWDGDCRWRIVHFRYSDGNESIQPGRNWMPLSMRMADGMDIRREQVIRHTDPLPLPTGGE